MIIEEETIAEKIIKVYESLVYNIKDLIGYLKFGIRPSKFILGYPIIKDYKIYEKEKKVEDRDSESKLLKKIR